MSVFAKAGMWVEKMAQWKACQSVLESVVLKEREKDATTVEVLVSLKALMSAAV